MVTDNGLLKVLDALEDREARNLVWGLTDEAWTEQELLDFIGEAAPAYDPDDVLDALISHHLVFKSVHGWPAAYRTRMAEAMRLLASLRQLFPGRPWQSAPRLVADFRFRHETRRFPRRELLPDQVVEEMDHHGIERSIVEAAERVINGRRLSRFQLDSTLHVLQAMTRRDRGVVVSAGTGSGKTLAFYLPALSHLATRSRSDSVGVVALYPRNELLKDQLATAVDEVRHLSAAGGRALRIGAYFGPTPFSADSDPDWSGKPGEDRECPFLTCRARPEGAPPDAPACGGILVWNKEDLRQRREQLTCRVCGAVIGPDVLVLTRRSMQDQPPDLLFTTTEMLNRLLSDGWSMHLFGVGPRAHSAPALVLLDEVHTYEGTNGAQAAYLMRRWRRLMRGTPAWVGLSATLAGADKFFADLCGLADSSVEEVRPGGDQMEPKGREYQVVLRGDPAPQTALLSTTIQTLMLLRRVLDPAGGGMGAYGSRVFAFCDNLDLVNRLYRQYLDAEGFTPFGSPKRGGVPLASLRMSAAAPANYGPVTDWRLRDDDGQEWWMPEELGFDGTLLRLGRTSSQDSGVRSDADVIITTASLEVGFDDPEVGGVVQHKAPRDIAQFLQRRGRAGRTQIQRPWTVVVLSDYGRDRAAYQDYEALLDPALPEKRLPLGNQSVRKMQAAMCMLDWAAKTLDVARRKKARSMRSVFVGPQPGKKEHTELAEKTAELLAKVMAGGPERDDLMEFVGSALRLEPDELASVCWEPPRALLVDAVPTAQRRLASGWAAYQNGASEPGAEAWVRDSPLPEFIPKALFSDLCLPEVAIEAPPNYDRAADVSIPVQLALNELAPGKVTLRWAVNTHVGLWTPPAEDGHPVALEAGLARSGHVLRTVNGDREELVLVRPLVTAPSKPDPDVKTSSNARMNWKLEFERNRRGIALTRPRSGPLVGCVESVTAYLHAGRGGLPTWRYASKVTATISRTAKPRERRVNTFTYQGQPAAVGYEAMVDALLVTLRVPESLDAFRLASDQPRLRQLRRDFFTTTLRARLEAVRLDPFLATRIADTVIAAAAAVLAAANAPSLSAVTIAEWRAHAAAVVVSGTVDLGETDDDDGGLSRQQQELLQSLDDPGVTTALTACVPLLQADPDNTWLPWLQARYVHTMAAAWQVAAQAMCPDFDVEDDSEVDVLATEGQAQFLLSDASIGGGGLIEALAARISEDPRRFDYLVFAALEPSDLEEVDASMRHCLALLQTDKEVADTAVALRAVSGDRLAQWQEMLNVLAARGISTAHASMSALASRIFRRGSSVATDELLRQCVERWDAIEEKADFAIDHRGICAALAADPAIRTALSKAIAAPSADEAKWANSVLLGLLWPSAPARRAAALVASNRFVGDAPATERTIVLDTLPDPASPVDVDSDDWPSILAHRVSESGRCLLVSGSSDRHRLKQALQYLATQPVELSWLHVHPRIEAVQSHEGLVSIEISLEEVPQ